jgi:hypothetical protein
MGAAMGHAADNLLSGGLNSPKSGEMGLGSLLLGGLGKILAASVKDTNPELSATLDSMATGAVAGAAFKAAASMKPEPLIEEARKAVAEAAKAGQPLSADSPPRVEEVPLTVTGTRIEPLVEVARLAMADLKESR